MIKQLAGLILAFLPALSHSCSSFGADYVAEYYRQDSQIRDNLAE
jgi:hypothetical protein